MKNMAQQRDQQGIPENSLVDLRINDNHIFFTACHRIPSRSFKWKGKPILCYRCLGLNGSFFLLTFIQLVGFILLIVDSDLFFTVGGVIFTFGPESIGLQFLIAIGLQVPFIVDGTIQAVIKRYESTNITRFLTGIIGGVGQYLILFVIGRLIS